MLLQRIRASSRSSVSWFFAILITLAFSLWGLENFLVAGRHTERVARVNGNDISRQHFRYAYDFARQATPGQHANLAALKQSVLDQMILRQILVGNAEQMGLGLPEDEVKAALLALPEFQEDGAFSPLRFALFARHYPGGGDGLLQDYHRDLLVNQLRVSYLQTAFALPGDVAHLAKALQQRRDFDYLLIPAQSFQQNSQPTAAEIQAYYDKHQDDFRSPEQVTLRYLHLRLADVERSVQPSQSELKAFYQRHRDQFSKPPRWHVAQLIIPAGKTPKTRENAREKAMSWRQQAMAGADFAALAQQHSSDVVTRKKGGDLGWLTLDQLPVPYRQAVSAAAEGDITSPLWIEHGYALVRVIAHEPRTELSFAAVRQDVEQRYRRDRAQSLFAERIEQLTDLTYANPETLQVAAETLTLTPQESIAIVRGVSAEKGLWAHPKVLAAAFSEDVLQGSNSAVLELDPENALVVRLLRHVPARVKPLADVKAIITTRLVQQKATQQAAFLAEHLAQGNADRAAAAQYGLRWQTITGAHRDATDPSAAVVGRVFQIVAMSGKPALKWLRLPNGDAAVIRLNRVYQQQQRGMTLAEKHAVRLQFARYIGQTEYQGYLAKLRGGASVETFLHP